jgi:hypothetical protein
VHISFSLFFKVSHHILDPTVFGSHFPHFSVFLSYSMCYSVHFSFSTFLSVSHHNPRPTVCISHFATSLVFLAIFYFIQCLFSFSMIFCFLSILQML